MKSNWKFASVATAVLMVGAFSTNTAFAEGFLAGIVKAVVPDAAPLADALDQANADLGNPVDAAGAAIVDDIVPGAGPVVFDVWTHQQPQ